MRLSTLRPVLSTLRPVPGPFRAAALGTLALAGLLALGVGAPPDAGAAPAALHGSARADRAPRYYLSLGDSYAVGYQPSPLPGATGGYTAYVAAKTHLRLVNYGCGGATTSSLLTADGCASPYGPPAAAHAASYPHQTQVGAATSFMRRHRGEIGLVTVSIGGNTVTRCASAASPTGCVLSAIPEIERNVTRLAADLRAAAGRHVPILGLTYPDVLLGLWVYPSSHADTSLASLSVTAFKSLLNPALTKAYSAAGAHLVDITAATGGYVPLTKTTTLAPYGKIPVAVAKVCTLTWYCTQGNIHAKTAGYDLIGKAVVARYRAVVARRR